jgi:TonB dependent receptor
MALSSDHQSNLLLPSPYTTGANPLGFITVKPGDRLPQIPVNSAKVNVRYHWTDAWSTDVEAVVASNAYLEGDDANLQKPVPGYVVFNAETEYQVTPHFQLYVQLDNITDNKYARPSAFIAIRPGTAPFPSSPTRDSGHRRSLLASGLGSAASSDGPRNPTRLPRPPGGPFLRDAPRCDRSTHPHQFRSKTVQHPTAAVERLANSNPRWSSNANAA